MIRESVTSSSRSPQSSCRESQRASRGRSASWTDPSFCAQSQERREGFRANPVFFRPPLAMIVVPRGETPQIIRMSAGLGPRQELVNVLTPSEDGTFAFTVSYLEDGKPTALDEYRSWLDR